MDAYVYVSAVAGDTDRTRVYGFAAAPSGELTPVTGSPFAADVTYMAVNGRYLFGSDAAGAYIHAYAIRPDGALRATASTNVVRPGNKCDAAGALFVDPAGATVYNVALYGSNCAEAAYQAFEVEKSSGRLELRHEARAGMNGSLLRFSGDSQLAFGAGCTGSQPLVYEYVRQHDGSLARVALDTPLPARDGDDGWCPYMAVATGRNHLLVPVYPTSGSAGPTRSFQLATYTVGEDGSLSTDSTADKMAKVAVGDVTDVAVAPGGTLAAVAGSNGLQVFRLADGKPANALPGLLTRQEVDQMFWDADGHLFAISQGAGELWVFNVDEDGWTPAPGSPYAVGGAQNITVQPVELQPKNDLLRGADRAASDVPHAAS